MRGLRLGLAVAALVLGVLTHSGPARAHQSSVVFSEIAVDGRTVEVTLQVQNSDLYEALGLERDRPASEAEAQAGAARIAAYLGQRITVTNHGQPCPLTLGESSLVARPAGDGYLFMQGLRYRCPRTVEDGELTYNLFFDIDPRHQGLARVKTATGETEHAFRQASRTLTLGRPLGVLDNVRDYLELGVEHIFTGYDHLAFLLGLLVIAGGVAGSAARGSEQGTRDGARRGLGYVIRVVTAFTLAHSVTLIASALGWVALPGRLVESVIAASIAYVALENILRKEPRHRFLLTFGFGLMHGFGFASVLREIGLPRAGLLLSLLSFNVGVELGQLVVVALAFPVLFLLALRGTRGRFRGLELALGAVLLGLCALIFVRYGLPVVQVLLAVLGAPAILGVLVPRYGYDRCVRIGGSAVLLGFSLFWLLERATGRTLLGGMLG